MNYYNYLKNELNNNYDFNKNKKKIIHLLIFSHILILLEIIFSSLFVSYFVKLSNFIYINHHQDKHYSQTWISEHQALNADLLISMIVFWVIFIVCMIWFIWYLNTLNLKRLVPSEKYNQVFNFALVFNILGLFICFLSLIGLSLINHYLVWYKKQLKQLSKKNKK